MVGSENGGSGACQGVTREGRRAASSSRRGSWTRPTCPVQVAFAGGYASVRRFNDAVRARLGPPAALRRIDPGSSGARAGDRPSTYGPESRPLETMDPSRSPNPVNRRDFGRDWNDPAALTEYGEREPTEPWTWAGPLLSVTGNT
jgi:hypothetical protein